jgi:hypothetical protein
VKPFTDLADRSGQAVTRTVSESREGAGSCKGGFP